MPLSQLSALSKPDADICSIWAWLSTPPGSTSRDDASISRAPAGSPLPIAEMMPFLNTHIGDELIVTVDDAAGADNGIEVAVISDGFRLKRMVAGPGRAAAA